MSLQYDYPSVIRQKERKALDEALLVWRFKCFNRYIKKLSNPAEMSAIRKNQQARHSTLLENL